MREIKTIEVARYSEPDEQGRVKQVGMISPQEAFAQLEAHLKAADLLPDEYFMPGFWQYKKGVQLPDYRTADCHVNWGGNEGIYLNISLMYYDGQDVRHFDFATGKTLGTSGDDFLRMSRIAAECSMMLNGWGRMVRVEEQEQFPVRDAEGRYSKDELTDMLEGLASSSYVSDREAAAKQGYALERLVFDESWHVRACVARRGYGVKFLANDPVPEVRLELARNGFGLDLLINDSDDWVRQAVAMQGYGLDRLVHDESVIVREAVAQQGYGLDVLTYDAEWFVRERVAKQGFGCDLLVNDKTPAVRHEAINYLLERGITLADWIKDNPDRCALPENRKPDLNATISKADRVRFEQRTGDKAMAKEPINRDERC